MRFLLTVLPITAALIIAACSPSEAPAPTAAPAVEASAGAAPAPGKTAPANPALGSPEWVAWVDKTLAISDDGQLPKDQETKLRESGYELEEAKSKRGSIVNAPVDRL